MKMIASLEELQSTVASAKKSGRTVGFVPTMGYLHEGHLSLVRKARQEAGMVVVSIYVNPMQFAAGEDFLDYPKDIERDVLLAKREAADVIFFPGEADVYPQGFSTYVEVEGLTSGLCGSSRPGHFRGVATVVAKLFNMVQPDTAYFGQKDAQQALVIKRMTRDLNFSVEIKMLPTVREEDGLAMSSRNTYLSPEERKVAPLLYKSLQMAAEKLKMGERQRESVIGAVIEMLGKERKIQIDYVDIVSTADLKPVTPLQGEILIALAVKLGRTRLIDNIIVGV